MCEYTSTRVYIRPVFSFWNTRKHELKRSQFNIQSVLQPCPLPAQDEVPGVSPWPGGGGVLWGGQGLLSGPTSLALWGLPRPGRSAHAPGAVWRSGKGTIFKGSWFFYTQLVGFSVIKTLSCWSRTFPDFWKAMNSQGLQRYSTLTSLKGESEEISWSTRDEPRPWRKTYSLIFKEFLYCLLNARQNKFSFSLLVLFIIQHVKHEG